MRLRPIIDDINSIPFQTHIIDSSSDEKNNTNNINNNNIINNINNINNIIVKEEKPIKIKVVIVVILKKKVNDASDVVVSRPGIIPKTLATKIDA